MSIAKKALLFTSALALLAGQSATASMRLSGAGASFPAKIYTRSKIKKAISILKWVNFPLKK